MRVPESRLIFVLACGIDSSMRMPTSHLVSRARSPHRIHIQHDSVVSPAIAYDLMLECKAIGEGLKCCPELLGEDVVIEPIETKVH